jgi:hypothetical protein
MCSRIILFKVFSISLLLEHLITDCMLSIFVTFVHFCRYLYNINININMYAYIYWILILFDYIYIYICIYIIYIYIYIYIYTHIYINFRTNKTSKNLIRVAILCYKSFNSNVCSILCTLQHLSLLC